MDAETLNRALAEIAGWERCLCGRHWHGPTSVESGGSPPNFANSIDAQIRELDPLVEAKWGPFDERIEWIADQPRCIISPHEPNKGEGVFIYGKAGAGPTRAYARAAAILEALT